MFILSVSHSRLASVKLSYDKAYCTMYSNKSLKSSCCKNRTTFLSALYGLKNSFADRYLGTYIHHTDLSVLWQYNSNRLQSGASFSSSVFIIAACLLQPAAAIFFTASARNSNSS